MTRGVLIEVHADDVFSRRNFGRTLLQAQRTDENAAVRAVSMIR